MHEASGATANASATIRIMRRAIMRARYHATLVSRMHRLPMQPLVPGVVALPASSARYLVRVLRSKVGDSFEAFDPRAGVVAKGAIVSIARGGEEVQVAIDDVVPVDAREPPLVLVQGYPKGDKLGDVVRDATELGATTIIPA